MSLILLQNRLLCYNIIMKKLITTLLIIKKEDKILLAEKKRGFGSGLINGVGGKIEPNESIEEGMIRETQEEIGILPLQYEEVAEIVFDEFVKGEKTLVEMHVYLAKDYDGEPIETEEMKPIWIDIKDIPFEKMFKDDKFWLPEILKGNKLEAKFRFDENFNLLSYKIKTNKSSD